MAYDPNKKKKEETQLPETSQQASSPAVQFQRVDTSSQPKAADVKAETVEKPVEKQYATVDPWEYAPYTAGATTQKAQTALQDHVDAKVAPYESQWNAQVDDIVNKILNREKFSYDVNEDALYQQYADTYKRNAELMAADTTGRAAAMTGGYGNSWASTLGASAYAAEMQKLNDKIPELYQLAYDMYQNEGQDLYNRYGLLSSEEAQDYARYRDAVADYKADRDYLAGRYDAERNFDYGVYADDKAYGFENYWKDIDRQDTITAAENDSAYKYYATDVDIAENAANREQSGLVSDRNYDMDVIGANNDALYNEAVLEQSGKEFDHQVTQDQIDSSYKLAELAFSVGDAATVAKLTGLDVNTVTEAMARETVAKTAPGNKITSINTAEVANSVGEYVDNCDIKTVGHDTQITIKALAPSIDNLVTQYSGVDMSDADADALVGIIAGVFSSKYPTVSAEDIKKYIIGTFEDGGDKKETEE